MKFWHWWSNRVTPSDDRANLDRARREVALATEEIAATRERLTIVTQDITSGVYQAEAEASTMEVKLEDYRRMVEALPEGIIATKTDEAGRAIIIFVSQRGANMFGYSPIELVGQPLALLIPTQAQARQARAYAQASATGAVKNFSFSAVARHKDGSDLIVTHAVGRYETSKSEVRFVASITILK